MVNSVEFSRDGKLLVSGGRQFARVTDRETGKQLHAFEGHTSLVLGASLQANGRTLASVGADGEIKVWNLVSGDRAGKQSGYKKEITSIRFIGLTDQAFVTTGEKRPGSCASRWGTLPTSVIWRVPSTFFIPVAFQPVAVLLLPGESPSFAGLESFRWQTSGKFRSPGQGRSRKARRIAFWQVFRLELRFRVFAFED